MFKLLVLGVLFYLLYATMVKPLLSNNKLVDTNDWKEEEEGEFVEYEEIEEESK